MKQPHQMFMVSPFDAAWSIIKQYDVNSYRGQRTLGRDLRSDLREQAMQGAEDFHQARIDAAQNLPDPRMARGAFSQPRGEPFNPFKGEQPPRPAAPNMPIDTGAPTGATGVTQPLSAGKPREMRRGGARPPATPRPGFRSREEMPLNDFRFQ
jgi:hypothetical protein